MTDDFWDNRFHRCALAVGFVAHAEGWLHDSERVRRVVYHLYERGEWPSGELTTGPDRATPALTTRTHGGTHDQTQTETDSGRRPRRAARRRTRLARGG